MSPKAFSSHKNAQVFRVQKGPATARATIRVLAATALAALGWAHYTQVPELALASGTVQPTGALRRVEHLDGGVVSRILVAEGDFINSDQELVRLTEDDVEAQLESLRIRESVLERAVARNRILLNAIGFSASQPASPVLGSARADAQLKTYEARRQRLYRTFEYATQRVATAESILVAFDERGKIEDRELTRLNALSQSGLISASLLAQAELNTNNLISETLSARAALEQALSDQIDAQSALEEYFASFRETLLADIEATEEELALIQRAVVTNRLQYDRLLIVAPVSGVIQRLYLSSVDEVVEPGGLVAEVLPTTEKLIAELRLKPSDIGHIDLGDPVEVNFTTFKTKRFGSLQGTVRQVSATSDENELGETYFLVRVDLERQSIGEGSTQRRLRAGMEVNATIRTGERSILEYALDPVIGPFKRAFHER